MTGGWTGGEETTGSAVDKAGQLGPCSVARQAPTSSTRIRANERGLRTTWFYGHAWPSWCLHKL